MADVRILGDGSCELLDWFDFTTLTDTTVSWASSAELADAWFAESREGSAGPAFRFLWSACREPVEGFAGVLGALADAAGYDEELLAAIGAGPLEDLLQSAGDDPRLLDEIEQAARQEPSVRTAMRSVWMGPNVAPDVRERLVKYGAHDITG